LPKIVRDEIYRKAGISLEEIYETERIGNPIGIIGAVLARCGISKNLIPYLSSFAYENGARVDEIRKNDLNNSESHLGYVQGTLPLLQPIKVNPNYYLNPDGTRRRR